MIVNKVDTKRRSCNFCDADYTGDKPKYNYTNVYEFTKGHSGDNMPSICADCAKELYDKIQQLKD